jgi:predicted Fe-S protein YdhL (DUF1289 family)
MSCTKETKILEHCIRECSWDKDMTHCTGCLLTKAELKNWYRKTDKEKKSTLKAAERRLKDH